MSLKLEENKNRLHSGVKKNIHTAGRSGIVRRWCSLPNITVFSGKTSFVINEQWAPITQPLVNVILRPTCARLI